MTKNQDVFNAFIDGKIKPKTKSVFIHDKTIYSYGYHFPMALKLLDCYVMNKDKYSMTTTTHQNALAKTINKTMIFTTTNKLKKLISDYKIKCYSDLILEEL